MEDFWMSEETKLPCNHDSIITLEEILFATLLGIAGVSIIWLSSTLIIHLFRNI
jgi:hypothetical protein